MHGMEEPHDVCPRLISLNNPDCVFSNNRINSIKVVHSFVPRLAVNTDRVCMETMLSAVVKTKN